LRNKSDSRLIKFPKLGLTFGRWCVMADAFPRCTAISISSCMNAGFRYLGNVCLTSAVNVDEMCIAGSRKNQNNSLNNLKFTSNALHSSLSLIISSLLINYTVCLKKVNSFKFKLGI
jgi:hypothetical protein